MENQAQIDAIRMLVHEIELDGHHTPDPECQNRICRALYLIQTEVLEPYDLLHQPVSENGSRHPGG